MVWIYGLGAVFKMKIIIFGLLAILLMGGGAAGAYFFFAKPAEAAAPVNEAKKAEHDAKAKKAEEGAEGAAAAQFVQLAPMILPIIDDEGVSQTVSLVVSIEVPDEATAKEVKQMSPRLQDAFLQEMYGTLNQKNAMDDSGMIRVAAIKSRLNKVSVKVLGQDKVNGVLLQVLQQRSI